MPVLRQFIDWNVRLCDCIEQWLPDSFTRSLLYLHEQSVSRIMSAEPSQLILDIGCGRNSKFVQHRKPGLKTRIVGLELIEDEIRLNTQVDLPVVADASGALPFQDRSVNVVTTSSVLEHLPDNTAFFRESRRVLKPGGHAAHVFPCRFAPFAIINQILPNRIARGILNYIFPEWRDLCGFKAYYKNCYYPRMVNLLEANGLQVQSIYFRYYQAIYYKFFLPFYVIALIYDLLIWRLGIRRLCCQILVISKKEDSNES